MNSNMHNRNTLTFDLIFLNITIKLELVAVLGAIYYPFVFVSIHILTQCGKEKKTRYLNVSFLLHICTYLTFGLAVTLKPILALGIHH